MDPEEEEERKANTSGIFDSWFDHASTQASSSSSSSSFHFSLNKTAFDDAFQETFLNIQRPKKRKRDIEETPESLDISAAERASLDPPTFTFHYRLPTLPPEKLESFKDPSLYNGQQISIPFPSCTIRTANTLDTIEIRKFQIAVLADQTCTLLQEGDLEVTQTIRNPNTEKDDLILASEISKGNKTQEAAAAAAAAARQRPITFYLATNYQYPYDILLPVLSSTSTSSQLNAWNTMKAGEFFTSETKQKTILLDSIFARTAVTSPSISASYQTIWQHNLYLFLLCMFPTTKFHTLPISTYQENVLKQEPAVYSPEMTNSSLAERMTVYKRKYLVKRAILHDDIYKNMLMRFLKDQFVEATLQILSHEKAAEAASAAATAAAAAAAAAAPAAAAATTGSTSTYAYSSSSMPITSYKDIDWVDRYITSRYRLIRRENVQPEWLEDAAWVVDEKSENVDLTKRIARMIPILPENIRMMRYLNARPYLEMISNRDSSLQKVQDVIFAKRKLLERAFLPNWAHDFLTGRSSTAFINLCNLFSLFGIQNMQWTWSHPCLAQLLQSVSKLESEDVEFISARRALQQNSGMRTYREYEREKEKHKAVDMAKSAALLKTSPEKRTEIIDGKRESQLISLQPAEKQYLALLIFLNHLVYQTERDVQSSIKRHRSAYGSDSASAFTAADTMQMYTTQGLLQNSSSPLFDPAFHDYFTHQLAYMPFSPSFASTQSPVVITLQLDLIDATHAFIANASSLKDENANADFFDKAAPPVQKETDPVNAVKNTNGSTFMLSTCQISRIHIQNHQLYSNDIMAWYPKDHFFIPQLYLIGPIGKNGSEGSALSTISKAASQAANKGIQWLTGSMYGNRKGGAVVTKKEQQILRQLQNNNNEQTTDLSTSVNNVFSYGNHLLTRPTLGRIYYIYQFLMVIHVHRVLSVKDSFGNVVSLPSSTASAASTAAAAAAAASTMISNSGVSTDIMVDSSTLPFPTGSYSSVKRSPSEYWNMLYPWRKLNILPGTANQYSDGNGLNYESAYRFQQLNDLVDFKRKKMEEVPQEIRESLNEYSPAVLFYFDNRASIVDFCDRLERMIMDNDMVVFFNSHRETLQKFLKHFYSNISQRRVDSTKRLTSEINASELLSQKHKQPIHIIDPNEQLLVDLTNFTTLSEESARQDTANPLVRFDQDCIEQKSLSEIRKMFSEQIRNRVSNARISVQDGQALSTLSADQMMTNTNFQDIDHFMHLVDLSGRNENEISKLFSLFAIVQNYRQVKDVLDETGAGGNHSSMFRFSMKKWFLLGPLYSLNKKVFGRDSNNQSSIENSLRDIIQTMFTHQNLLFRSAASSPQAVQIKEELLQRIHFLMQRSIRSAIISATPMIDMQTFLFSLLFLSMLIRGRSNFHDHVIEPSNAVIQNYEKAVLENARQLHEATKYEEELKKKVVEEKRQADLVRREQEKKIAEAKKQQSDQKREQKELERKTERQIEKDKREAKTLAREEKRELEKSINDEKKTRKEQERKEITAKKDQERKEKERDSKEEKARKEQERKQKEQERKEERAKNKQERNQEKADRKRELAEKEEKKKKTEEEKKALLEQQKEDALLPDKDRLREQYSAIHSFLYPDSNIGSYETWHLMTFRTLQSATYTNQLSTVRTQLSDKKSLNNIILKLLTVDCPLEKKGGPSASATATATAAADPTGTAVAKLISDRVYTEFTSLFAPPKGNNIISSLFSSSPNGKWDNVPFYVALTELAQSFMIVSNGPVQKTTTVDANEMKKFNDMVASFKRNTAAETRRKLEQMKNYIDEHSLTDPWLRMYMLAAGRKAVIGYTFEINMSAVDGIIAINASAAQRKTQQLALEQSMLRFIQELIRSGFTKEGLFRHVNHWLCTVLTFIAKSKVYPDWIMKQVVFLLFVLVLLDPNYIQSIEEARRSVRKATATVTGIAKIDPNKMSPAEIQVLEKQNRKNRVATEIRSSLKKNLPYLHDLLLDAVPLIGKVQQRMYEKQQQKLHFGQWLLLNHGDLTYANSMVIFRSGNWSESLMSDANLCLIFRDRSHDDDSDDDDAPAAPDFAANQNNFMRFVRVIHEYLHFIYDIQPGDALDVKRRKVSKGTLYRPKFAKVLMEWRDSWIRTLNLQYDNILHDKKDFITKKDATVFENIISLTNTIQPADYADRIDKFYKYMHSVALETNLFTNKTEEELVNLGIQDSTMYALSYVFKLDKKMIHSLNMISLLEAYVAKTQPPDPFLYTSLEKRYLNLTATEDDEATTTADVNDEEEVNEGFLGLLSKIPSAAMNVFRETRPAVEAIAPPAIPRYVQFFQTIVFQLFMMPHSFKPLNVALYSLEQRDLHNKLLSFRQNMWNAFAINADAETIEEEDQNQIQACIMTAQTIISTSIQITNTGGADLVVTNNLPTLKVQTMALALLLDYLYIP